MSIPYCGHGSNEESDAHRSDVVPVSDCVRVSINDAIGGDFFTVLDLHALDAFDEFLGRAAVAHTPPQ